MGAGMQRLSAMATPAPLMVPTLAAAALVLARAPATAAAVLVMVMVPAKATMVLVPVLAMAALA